MDTITTDTTKTTATMKLAYSGLLKELSDITTARKTELATMRKAIKDAKEKYSKYVSESYKPARKAAIDKFKTTKTEFQKKRAATKVAKKAAADKAKVEKAAKKEAKVKAAAEKKAAKLAKKAAPKKEAK